MPLHDITSRHNPSTPWFDIECRSIKLLKHRYHRTKDPVDRLAWNNALWEKHSAFKSKENSYWENTVRSNSSKLWRSVSTILGEPAKQSANLASFSASDFLNFLEKSRVFVQTRPALLHLPSPQPPAHLPRSHCVHRNWCGRWLEERLQRAVNWTQHWRFSSKSSWKSCFHSSQGCATPLSKKVVCCHPRRLPLRGFRVHLYADDTQFHDSCRSTDAAVLAARAMRVIEAVRDWMSSNRLRLNTDKTQFIWLGTSHFLDVLQINSIPANEVVNNLGVYFDPELLMERQVNKLCQVCYFHLRCLRTVRQSLTKESLLTLVHAFITSRIDHCNGVLYGSNGYLLDRLQSILNSAARLILGVPKFESVSAAIRNELHWLLIGKRIQFKIALLVRHCIVGAAPEYLTELCRPVSSSSGRQCLRSASRGDLIVPRFRLRKIWLQGFCCL